jgi:multiple sugar transport system substrate-binding protein
MTSWRKRGGVVAALGGAVALLITAGLASAQPSTTTGADAPAVAAAPARTLNIYGFGPGDDVANGRAAYAENQLGSNVGVDNPRGGFNDQAFLAMLASGNVPDIVYMNRRSIGTYAARRALLPLANCIRSENINTVQYRAAALKEVRYQGQTYALPEFTNQITIIVDDSVAQDAGVAVNAISTKNWAALRQVSKRLMRVENGRLTRIGFDPKIPEFFPLWVKWFGNNSSIIAPNGRPQLNTPQAVAALNFTLSIIRDHGGWSRFKAFRDTFDFFGRQNPLVQNQIGAWPMESFIYNVFANNSPNSPLTAKYFVNRRGGPITMFAGSGWAIPRGSRDPDLACKWMKAMTSVDAWRTVARNRLNARRAANPPQAFTGLYTANTRADLVIYQDIYQPVGNPQFDDAVQKLYTVPKYAFALPPSRASAEINQAMIDGINRALEGRQSPRAALNQAQREALAAYNRNG